MLTHSYLFSTVGIKESKKARGGKRKRAKRQRHKDRERERGRGERDMLFICLSIYTLNIVVGTDAILTGADFFSCLLIHDNGPARGNLQDLQQPFALSKHLFSPDLHFTKGTPIPP